MGLPIKFSSGHYMLGGVVYTTDFSCGDHEALRMVLEASVGSESAAETAAGFGLVLPGETGEILRATYVNGSPVFEVRFASGVTKVGGKFLTGV